MGAQEPVIEANDRKRPSPEIFRGVAYSTSTGIVVILNGAINVVKTLTHEVGHATMNHFPRAYFGTGDHSTAGLMFKNTSTATTFTSAEQETLKGFKQ